MADICEVAGRPIPIVVQASAPRVFAAAASAEPISAAEAKRSDGCLASARRMTAS